MVWETAVDGSGVGNPGRRHERERIEDERARLAVERDADARVRKPERAMIPHAAAPANSRIAVS